MIQGFTAEQNSPDLELAPKKVSVSGDRMNVSRPESTRESIREEYLRGLRKEMTTRKETRRVNPYIRRNEEGKKNNGNVRPRSYNPPRKEYKPPQRTAPPKQYTPPKRSSYSEVIQSASEKQ